ncbi:MAG: T9SS type A sorting domain-containing protein [Calditrichaeota bacterium]|nr:T9SS type A sorting domain-containing protein [Calditrichota bacterium]
MMKKLMLWLGIIACCMAPLMAQTNTWGTHYTTYDASDNGTGYQTSSAAVIGPNRFVALVTQTPASPILDNLFNPPGNYLVGYWDADSALGLINSPINGSSTTPRYGFDNQFTDWESGLDLIRLDGAWQMAADNNGRIYVANNDADHNILVFQMDSQQVSATEFRMSTGITENIFGVEVDDNGYVYVVDYEGNDTKTDEVKVYAGIGAPNTTWGDFGGHNDAPVATIDLPTGNYLGITCSGDGSAVYVSATTQRTLLKFTGSPTTGYTQDAAFQVTLAADDTISNGGYGTPSFVGLAFMNNPPRVYAAVDSFIHRGDTGGYPYGRIYSYDAVSGAPEDTIDIAEWNFIRTGDYSSGSNDGRAGGYTSVIDVDVEESEQALYTQTYYGWAVEKWVYDGTLSALEPVDGAVPSGFELGQNYPNPFNPSTTISFKIDHASRVSLNIYNITGQKVASLIEENLAPGTYQTEFNAANLPSGVYFYQLNAGSLSIAKKMVLAR